MGESILRDREVPCQVRDWVWVWVRRVVMDGWMGVIPSVIITYLHPNNHHPPRAPVERESGQYS